ncbi:MAG TPA: SsrA-binding protein SmpB [Planctomycetota bacterium]|nr:SsrA-binding protein SmpB [Planctomycetota bacterium]
MSDKDREKPGIKLIQRNKKAFFNYEIVEKLEAGIVLQGSEVKSIRDGKVTIQDAYARVKNGEVWVIGMDVALYPQAGPYNNHVPRQTRKLLLHRQEIRRLDGKTKEKGLTLVPLALYFKDGLAKLELGLARGKKQYDKRRSIKDREAKRDLRRRMMK